MTEISLVITSFNRFDLLVRTIESLREFNKYPIKDFILIEDSGDKEMHKKIIGYFNNASLGRQLCEQIYLVLNPINIGAYESIDFAYSHIHTPYVLHCEDDWEFYKGGFIEKALKVLESNPKIMQVNLSNEQNMPIEPEVFKAGDVEYRLEGTSKDGFWNGFTCNPSVRSMAGYEKTKLWTQYANKTDEGYFLALHEMKVGKRYFELGYRAAVLNEYYCKHIGIGRCTWHS